MQKINAAAKHNMGFMTAELSGAALLDLNWGHLNPEGDFDVMAFENSVAEKLGMPSSSLSLPLTLLQTHLRR